MGLVVDTTNFTDKILYRGAAENLHLTERFTRVGPGEIDSRVTISDSTTFSKPWTLAIAFVNTGEEMFEYACHEGNYGMEGNPQRRARGRAGGRHREKVEEEVAMHDNRSVAAIGAVLVLSAAGLSAHHSFSAEFIPPSRCSYAAPWPRSSGSIRTPGFTSTSRTPTARLCGG